MWARITSFIVRNRISFLFLLLGITAYMGYRAKDAALSYDFPQIIPSSDSDYVQYQAFKEQFGEDGDLLIIGFQSKYVFSRDVFNSWYRLTEDVKKVPGVQSVAAVTNLPILEKDTASRKFKMRPLISAPLQSQEQADSLQQQLKSLPFYKNFFYNDSTHATLMAVKLNQETLHSSERVRLMDEVKEKTEHFAARHRLDLAYTGLPYIRTTFAFKVQKELNLFLILSVIITSIILLLFFRSVYNVIFPLAIIAIIVIWTLGFLSILGYKITLLTGLIPPLIVVIAVPNFIYFMNRYHNEYRKYGNKLRAIIMMVNNIAKVIFLNNITTAIGFGVQIFVNSPILKEFGVVAFIMVTATYVASIILLPIVFSFLPAPSAKQTRYLNNRLMNGFIEGIISLVMKRRALVYSAAVVIALVCGYGVTRLKTLAFIMDDIPYNDKLYTDLQWFENNFKGVMPFEITINTGKPRGAQNLELLGKVDQLQDTLAAMPEFGKAVSIVNIAKYATQTFYGGLPSRYILPSENDIRFMAGYLRSFKLSNGGNGIGYRLTDTTQRIIRISTRMSDVGSERLSQIVNKLDKDIPEIFQDSSVTHEFTGFSKIFLKGNNYLIKNLSSSLVSAVLLIILVIAILFPSLRLVIVTLIPNCLAMLITAGLMGLLNIPLKASSVLVFSVAFGIAVDASFHFLVVYRQDLRQHNWDIPKTIAISLRETGGSIIYTSLVLFFGFGIFCFSTFGSTVILGALTSLTIMCAMFTNMILLPALLVSFDRRSRRKSKMLS